MNTSASPPFVSELAAHLRGFLSLCEETLALMTREHDALTGPGDYQPFEFYQGRKALLLRFDEGLNLLRMGRQAWQRLDAAEQTRHSEVKVLLQTVQDSLVKILVLDRENQQALLQRGLVPAPHVPSSASRTPHHAAQVYQRHSS
jgi:hypothetical protein